MRSTVPLEPENYSLDSHIPYLGRNCSISWEGLDGFMENFVISLEKKINLNNRKKKILLIRADLGKVTEA